MEFGLLLVCLLVDAATAASPFVGLWSGMISPSVVGTHDGMLARIQPSHKPGGFMIEHFWSNSSEKLRGSYQIFYASPNIGDEFTYCGQLHNFYTPKYVGWISTSFRTWEWSTNRWTFCAKEESGGCSAFKAVWSVQGDTMQFEVMLPPPVVHARYTAQRLTAQEAQHAGVPPQETIEKHQCWAYTAQNTEPKYRWYGQKVQLPPNKFPDVPKAPSHNYNCVQYNTNPFNVTLEWQLRPKTQTIWLKLTAETQGYVAFGLGPNFPGMKGAKIVWGWSTSGGQGCISTAYANAFAGTPTPTNETLIGGSVMSAGGYTSISWSQSMKDFFGPKPEPISTIMWAIGDTQMDSCGDIPSYHGGNRGLYMVSFLYPNLTTIDYMKC